MRCRPQGSTGPDTACDLGRRSVEMAGNRTMQTEITDLAIPDAEMRRERGDAHASRGERGEAVNDDTRARPQSRTQELRAVPPIPERKSLRGRDAE